MQEPLQARIPNGRPAIQTVRPDDTRTRRASLKIVGPDPLRSEHRRLLERDSAIPPHVLAAEGVISISDPSELPTPAQALRHPDDAKAARFGKRPPVKGGGIMFPASDEHGDVVWWQLRPDNPRRDNKGKAIRYESPRGCRLSLYIPRTMRPVLGDRTVPLVVTEGPRKVLAGVGAGFATIGVPGVWGWRVREGESSRPLPEFDAIALAGRLVYLVFDSDLRTNAKVRAALDALSAFLRSRGAAVVIVYLPDGPDGEKLGVDDFVAAGGSLAELLSDALVGALARPRGGDETCSACAASASRGEGRELRAQVGRFQDLEAGRRTMRASRLWTPARTKVAEQIVQLAKDSRDAGQDRRDLYFPAVAEACGVAQGTVSDVISIVRAEQRKGGSAVPLPFQIEDGERPNGRSLVSLVAIDPASHPGRDLSLLAAVPPPKGLGTWGGARYACKDHPEAGVDEIVDEYTVRYRRHVWRCRRRGCGRKVHQEIERLSVDRADGDNVALEDVIAPTPSRSEILPSSKGTDSRTEPPGTLASKAERTVEAGEAAPTFDLERDSNGPRMLTDAVFAERAEHAQRVQPDHAERARRRATGRPPARPPRAGRVREMF